MRRGLSFLIVGMSFLFLTKTVMAGGFNMKSIGNVSTEGLQISKWWYTGLQPRFWGETGAGMEVGVKIDETVRTINADSSGNWDYVPETALSTGEPNVVLTSQGSTIAFTLVLGVDQVDWEVVNTGGGEVLPTVGTGLPTAMLLALGIFLMVFAKIGGVKKQESIR